MAIASPAMGNQQLQNPDRNASPARANRSSNDNTRMKACLAGSPSQDEGAEFNHTCRSTTERLLKIKSHKPRTMVDTGIHAEQQHLIHKRPGANMNTSNALTRRRKRQIRRLSENNGNAMPLKRIEHSCLVARCRGVEGIRPWQRNQRGNSKASGANTAYGWI